MLLAWDTPTASTSAGWTRYVLERRFNQPVTIVRSASLARANFYDYDVIVLPSGNYSGVVGDVVVNRLKDWLRGGGTLVTLAEATRWATTGSVGLVDTTALLKDGVPMCPRAQAAEALGQAAVERRQEDPEHREDRAGLLRARSRSTTTRRFNPSASVPSRNRARCCESQSTPITGSVPDRTARPR